MTNDSMSDEGRVESVEDVLAEMVHPRVELLPPPGAEVARDWAGRIRAALDAARHVPGEGELHGDDEEALTQVEEITGDRTRAEIIVNRLACLWNRSLVPSSAVPGEEADERPPIGSEAELVEGEPDLSRWTIWPCPNCNEITGSEPDGSGCDHWPPDGGKGDIDPVEVVPEERALTAERLLAEERAGRERIAAAGDALLEAAGGLKKERGREDAVVADWRAALGGVDDR